jgi:hypothetical protein
MITGRDRLSSLFWLAVAIFVCFKSVQDDVGSFTSPGPGFLPFWSAVALGGLAMALSVMSFLKKQEEGTEPWIEIKWGKVILVVSSLLIYSMLLNILGYLVATFGLMLFLFGLTGRPRIWGWLASALLTTVLTYLIFYLWLNVQLPRGRFGF